MDSLASPADRRRIAALRLAAQRLVATRSPSPEDAVRWMLAIQAQDLPGAKWSVGLRTEGAAEADIDAALDAGRVVRSWPLRGTLHLVAAEDLGWLVALGRSRQISRAGPRRQALGITDMDVGRADAAVRAALEGRRLLSRDQLLDVMRSAGVRTDGQRGYHLIWYLAHAGTLVMGATHGRGQGFALFDEWVSPSPALDRDDALGRVALRYLRSHGPATDADLARWAGMPLREARRGRAICAGSLATVEIGDKRYHLDPEALEGATAEPGPAQPSVLLLPGFDEYLLGYGDRSAVLDPVHADHVVPGGNGMFRPTIVVDGEVVGTWRRTTRAGELVVAPELFGAIGANRHGELEAAAQALGSFLGCHARLASTGEPTD